MIEMFLLRATSRCRITDHTCDEDIGGELRKMDFSKIMKLVKELATAMGKTSKERISNFFQRY
jgi:hypothetical protein